MAGRMSRGSRNILKITFYISNIKRGSSLGNIDCLFGGSSTLTSVRVCRLRWGHFGWVAFLVEQLVSSVLAET